jgi:molybdopterin synthase catalytic subunit
MTATDPRTAARWRTGLSDEPLSLDDAHAFVADPRAGATVTFTGVVRDHADDRAVTGLDYEAYAELAEQRLAELAEAVGRRWPDLIAGWAVHRVGRLAVGDTAVVVATSSPHRDTAFEAGRHLIDELKATVPIWKKEHWAAGGAHWPGTD